MHFSFLVAIVALAASIMSINACAPREAPCVHDSDCCDKLDKCVLIVSRNGLPCTKFSLNDSPFGPRNISQLVLGCAIITAISPKRRGLNSHVAIHWWVMFPLYRWCSCWWNNMQFAADWEMDRGNVAKWMKYLRTCLSWCKQNLGL